SSFLTRLAAAHRTAPQSLRQRATLPQPMVTFVCPYERLYRFVSVCIGCFTPIQPIQAIRQISSNLKGKRVCPYV
ncbi:hypothetical protein, partial [Lepagella muris]|uniref:hypothetical protein n=1 Tax=Lepagella muris TaxID=3032870 RepID=UPI0023B7BE3A